MSFSSIVFVFGFLPIFLLLYYLVPGKFRNLVLFLGSLFFYAWGEPVYLILMLFSAFFNYYMALDLGAPEQEKPHRKANLIFTVVVNLLILGFFKYYGFLLDTVGGIFGVTFSHPQLSLPIGISFYTFKNLSYVFDVHKGKTKPQKNFFLFAVYSTMFPHMTAGPIIRYTDIQDQLSERELSLERFGVGAEFFIKGLAKKVLLADNLAGIYSAITAGNEMSVLSAWIGILAYTLEIYFDFSGYSDMAIGLGKMLGFDFAKNFDYPYISTSVTEFWRRWHISLGSWFRDYVYIPLGGNRVSRAKHIRNILVVWALTGLWHGASWNFILWGLYYGLLLLLEKYFLTDWLKRLPGWAANLCTMFAVLLGWVFFSQTDFASIGRYFGALFGFGASAFVDKTALYYLKNGFLLLVIGVLASRPGMYQAFKRTVRHYAKLAAAINVVLFFLSVAYMVYSSYTPFLYAQF